MLSIYLYPLAFFIYNISQDLLDYEVDSDDEWEEEEPGESLSDSEVSLKAFVENHVWVFTNRERERVFQTLFLLITVVHIYHLFLLATPEQRERERQTVCVCV